MKIETYIQKFNPCVDSQKYLRQFDTFQDAWAACDRGDWMLSAAHLLGVDLRVLTLAKGLCANTVRHLMKDQRSILAVDAAIAFGRGEIERRELAADAAAADAAADYAAYYYVAYTIAAAYYAAYAAHDISYTAYAAVDAVADTSINLQEIAEEAMKY